MESNGQAPPWVRGCTRGGIVGRGVVQAEAKQRGALDWAAIKCCSAVLGVWLDCMQAGISCVAKTLRHVSVEAADWIALASLVVRVHRHTWALCRLRDAWLLGAAMVHVLVPSPQLKDGLGMDIGQSSVNEQAACGLPLRKAIQATGPLAGLPVEDFRVAACACAREESASGPDLTRFTVDKAWCHQCRGWIRRKHVATVAKQHARFRVLLNDGAATCLVAEPILHRARARRWRGLPGCKCVSLGCVYKGHGIRQGACQARSSQSSRRVHAPYGHQLQGLHPINRAAEEFPGAPSHQLSYCHVTQHDVQVMSTCSSHHEELVKAICTWDYSHGGTTHGSSKTW